MRESTVETLLVNCVEEFGGLAYKVKIIGRTGFNDRLVILPQWPRAWIAVVELKAPGKKPRRTQELRHEEMRKRRVRVYVIDDEPGVRKLIDDFVDER